MKNYFLKFWPFIFIFIIWLIFSSPYFLRGKVPFSSTYQVNNFAPWSAYQELAGPVKNGAMPDVITQIYPWKHLAIDIWKSGQIPLWNPYSFSGTPLLANYQSAVFSPFNILFFIIPFVDAWSILVLLQPLLAGFFMYSFIRIQGLSKQGSLISALSFMFCGFMTVWMGYATLGYAILFLPLALFLVEIYLKTKKVKYLMFLSVTIPLSFFSGHFQISLYFLISVLIYIAYKFFTTKDLRAVFLLIIFVCLGLLLSSIQLISSIEFYLQSFRSTLFQKGEVIPFGYLTTLLAPDFFGNPVTRNDWFGHYAEWSGYIGIIPLFLAIYSILGKKRPQTLFLFFLGTLALLFSLDSPFSTFLISLKLPVVSTSSLSRVIVVYSFAFAALSAFGFDSFLKDLKNKQTKKFLILLSAFVILFSFLWLIVLLRLFIPLDKIVIARQNIILPSLIFSSFTFTALIAFVFSKHKNTVIFLMSIFILFLTAFDMLRFAKKWQAFDPKNLVFLKTQTADGFSKISGYNRVFGNFGAEAAVYYRLPSVEGYDSLYIKRYGELVSSFDDGRVKEAARSVVSFPKNGLYTSKAIGLLDIKYVVHKLADDHAVWTFPFWSYPNNQFKLIYKDSKYEFYENILVNPHILFTGDYKVISDPQKIVDTMFSKNFDLGSAIVLEKQPGLEIIKGNIGKAEIVKYATNKIDIKVEATNKGLLFLADSYYQGWNAKVDGRDTKIYRADYSFRAVVVPEGKHKVEFVYFPLSFKIGIWLAFVGFLGILSLGAILAKRK